MADVIDSEIVENHCIPVAIIHFACNMTSDVMVNFSMFLYLEQLAVANLKVVSQIQDTEVNQPFTTSERMK